MKEFSHFDAAGKAKMVDVTSKKVTRRTATAYGEIFMKKETLRKILGNEIQKGDTFTAAKLAGIMAAKKTSSLIPLCHPLALTQVDLTFKTDEKRNCIMITSGIKVDGKTGAEMEALTAVSAAALTIYDMCKAVDKEMTISNICLLTKAGGRSGSFKRKKSAVSLKNKPVNR